MLNFQFMTEADRKAAAKIDRRRAIEEERKKRIFNPKQRLIGIDIPTLEKQIEEKKRIQGEKERIEEVFVEHLKRADLVACNIEAKQKQDRRNFEKEIDEFRRNYQKFEDRREFDLNDPNLLKKLIPARLHDDDPRLGPASAQKFEGEDLTYEQRLKVQHEQIKAWLGQQIKEKDQALHEQKEAEIAYKAALASRDQRAVELERMEKECRRKLEKATLRYNEALANEKEMRKQRLKQQTEQDNLAEIYNVMTSDMMTENPEVANSNMGMGKKIGSLYKGMTAEELKEFQKAQMAQAEEVKARKKAEQRLEQEHDEYLQAVRKAVEMKDQELKKLEAKQQKALAEENLKMAQEQKLQQEFLNKVVYTNRPTAAYYDQFNTSTR